MIKFVKKVLTSKPAVKVVQSPRTMKVANSVDKAAESIKKTLKRSPGDLARGAVASTIKDPAFAAATVADAAITAYAPAYVASPVGLKHLALTPVAKRGSEKLIPYAKTRAKIAERMSRDGHKVGDAIKAAVNSIPGQI